MTDEELKALVARNSEAVAENSRAIREMREASEESGKRFEAHQLESARRFEASGKRFEAHQLESAKRFEASEKRFEAHQLESAKRFEASAKRFEASAKRFEASEKRFEEHQLRFEEHEKESERLWQEILASRADSDRLITSFNRQLGQLGNALGGYTESMFRPSLERVLDEHFKMTVVVSPVQYRHQGETLQIDMLAHAFDEIDEVYIVEIKSKLDEDTIQQLHKHLRRFPRFFPEHRGKKLFGVVAAMQIPDGMRTRVLKEGFYLATIRDDVFEIAPPDGFEPHVFGLRDAG